MYIAVQMKRKLHAIQCYSAMRVAGLAVFIVWRYSKPQVPAAPIEHVFGWFVQHMLNTKRFDRIIR